VIADRNDDPALDRRPEDPRPIERRRIVDDRPRFRHVGVPENGVVVADGDRRRS